MPTLVYVNVNHTRGTAMTIHTPICDLRGVEHPVLLAGMGGVSYAEVCAAVVIAWFSSPVQVSTQEYVAPWAPAPAVVR